MRLNLSAWAAVLLLCCPGKAGAEPGTVIRVADAHPCGEVVSFDGGWQCQPAVDAGVLPAGWWLSQPQMLKLGGRLAEDEHEIATLRATNAALVAEAQAHPETPPGTQAGAGLLIFLVGVVCGLGAAVGVVYLVSH